MKLLDRLKIAHKFALVMFVMIIPVLALLVLHTGTKLKQVSKAEAEIAGLALIQPSMGLMQELSRYRFLRSLQIVGGQDVREATKRVEASLHRRFSDRPRSASERLDRVAEAGWKRVAAQWDRLHRHHASSPAPSAGSTGASAGGAIRAESATPSLSLIHI